LSRDSHVVSTAVSLAAAVKALGTIDFDAVVLDLKLPDSDGADGVEIVHRIAPSVVLVVYTGNGNDAVKRECLLAGADGVVSKPARAEVVGNALLVGYEHRERMRRRSLAAVLATEAAIAARLGLSYVAAG